MLDIDHYAYQSRWRTVDPRIKASVFIVLLFVALCSVPMAQLGILSCSSLAACYATRITLGKYLRWLAIPLVFLGVSLLGILISFSWDGLMMLASVRIGTLYIGINPESLGVVYKTFCRSIACLSVTYLFVLTTPFDQLIIIGKKSRLPKVLLENILLTYRFIFIFIDEVVAIKRAQTLRFGYCSLITSYRSLGMLVSILLERVLMRYKAMSIALETKLFNGDFHL